jgi:Uma2 family endonuclease
VTWEEFEQYPDDAMHHELIDGEHQILPPKKAKHSIIAANVAISLEPLESNGRVFGIAGYRLSEATWIQPDVSFLTTDRILETDPDGYFLGAPDQAVEIISPSESARHIERKIALLLAKGSAAVWVIYPDSARSMCTRRIASQSRSAWKTRFPSPACFPAGKCPWPGSSPDRMTKKGTDRSVH